MVTGMVVQVSACAVVVARVIDGESREIDSPSQIIVPKDAAVKALL